LAVLKLGRNVVETAGEIKTSDSGALAFYVPVSRLRTGTYAIELTSTGAGASAGPPEEYRFELLIRP
jgi:hypothetical protein